MKRHLTLMLTAGVLALTAAPLRAQDAADVSAFTATGLDALARLDAIEAHLRATTGENERLRYELEQTRGQLRLLFQSRARFLPQCQPQRGFIFVALSHPAALPLNCSASEPNELVMLLQAVPI